MKVKVGKVGVKKKLTRTHTQEVAVACDAVRAPHRRRSRRPVKKTEESVGHYGTFTHPNTAVRGGVFHLVGENENEKKNRG